MSILERLDRLPHEDAARCAAAVLSRWDAIDRWAYSPSWYPVLKDEVVAAGGTIEEVVVERPDDPADLA